MSFNKLLNSVSVSFVQFVIIVFVFQVSAAPASFELQADLWETAREGKHLLQVDGLRTIVNAWSMEKDGHIELQYPGGEEGVLWVHQLMDWLVALGVPSANLIAVPGSGEGDVIRLQVIKSGDYFR